MNSCQQFVFKSLTKVLPLKLFLLQTSYYKVTPSIRNEHVTKPTLVPVGKL